MKKVLIFDFDGVFYSGEHKFDNVASFVNKYKRCFLPYLSDLQYNEVCTIFPEWENCVSGCDIVDIIYKIKKHYPQFKISTKDFWNWQQEYIYPIIVDYGQVADANYIKQLCKEYPVYIVSNSSPNHIKFYMKKLNINPEWFKNIYSNHFEELDRTKKHYYSEILALENCKPENAYVYGDSISSDLVPAKELNINAFHITNANDIIKIVDASLKMVKNTLFI